MKKHLQTLLFCLSLLAIPANVQAATMPLSQTDTVKQKGRTRLWTDPSYPPADGLVKGLFITGLLTVLVGVGLIAYFANSGGTDLGTAILVVLLTISGLVTLVIAGFIWLERFMISVNRRRKKDGKRKLNWIAVRVLQILLLAAWWIWTHPAPETV